MSEHVYDQDEENDTSEARRALLLAVLGTVEYIEALEARIAYLEGR